MKGLLAGWLSRRGCSSSHKVDKVRYWCEARRGHFAAHRALTHKGWQEWA